MSKIYASELFLLMNRFHLKPKTSINYIGVVLFDVCHLFVVIVRTFFTKVGIIGCLSGFLVSFFLYVYFLDKTAIYLSYPVNLNSEAINDFIIESDEKNILDDNYKMIKRNLSTNIKIEYGDSFGYVLYKMYVPSVQVDKISSILKQKMNLSKIKSGKKMAINYDCYVEYFATESYVQYVKKRNIDPWQGAVPMVKNKYCIIKQISIQINNNQRMIISNNGNGFDFVIKNMNIVSKIRFTKGIIENSLYGDAVSAGTPPGIIQAMIQEYSFDVDFQRDIKQGDSFLFVFEELFDEDGEKIRNGIFKYGNLVLGGKNHKIYYFNNEFFNEKAESVRKSIMKTPVDGARISSGFSKRRHHPVLGFTRKHEGVDFAVPYGTPIYAAADGVITYVGWSGGYGNYVKIRHNSEFGTNYAHMSRIKSGVKKGTRVRQREVIGYVGMTGIASGPHLHFEVEKHGIKINPNLQKFSSIKKLIGVDRDKFEEYRSYIKSYLAKNDHN